MCNFCRANVQILVVVVVVVIAAVLFLFFLRELVRFENLFLQRDNF